MFATYRILLAVLGLAIGITACSSPPEKIDDRDILFSDEERDVLDDLDEVVIGLESLTDNLEALTFLGEAQIVGLGEATHGTREFCQMKQAIFQKLVEENGFRGLGLAADFAESVLLNRYIETGEGDLAGIMKDTMLQWWWRSNEIQSLLEWIRSYNSGLAAGSEIYFCGIDCQDWAYQPELLHAYLAEVDNAYLQSIEGTLTDIQNLDSEELQDMSEFDMTGVSNRLQTILNDFNYREDSFVVQSSQREYEIAKHLVRTMQQSVEVIYYRTPARIAQSPYQEYMAENVAWMMDMLGTGSKLVIWAHNREVARDANHPSGRSLGHQLAQIYGDAYHSVAFSFSLGDFRARNIQEAGTPIRIHTIGNNPKISSTNLLFHYLDVDNFIVRTEDAADHASLSSWLQTAHPFLSVGSEYYDYPDTFYINIPLGLHFDAVINIDETNATHLLY